MGKKPAKSADQAGVKAKKTYTFTSFQRPRLMPCHRVIVSSQESLGRWCKQPWRRRDGGKRHLVWVSPLPWQLRQGLGNGHWRIHRNVLVHQLAHQHYLLLPWKRLHLIRSMFVLMMVLNPENYFRNHLCQHHRVLQVFQAILDWISGQTKIQSKFGNYQAVFERIIPQHHI